MLYLGFWYYYFSLPIINGRILSYQNFYIFFHFCIIYTDIVYISLLTILFIKFYYIITIFVLKKEIIVFNIWC